MAKNLSILPIEEQLSYLIEQHEIAKAAGYNDVANAYLPKISELKAQIEGTPLNVSEKKNELKSNVEQSADVQIADAPQQSSVTRTYAERDSLDVEAYTDSDDINSVLDKKWVGKIHIGSFKSESAFALFKKVKNKLKSLIVNLLKLKDLEFNDGSKKNLMIEASEELSRIVRNHVKKDYQKYLLERKFYIRSGGKKIYYGCDKALIDEIFKK